MILGRVEELVHASTPYGTVEGVVQLTSWTRASRLTHEEPLAYWGGRFFVFRNLDRQALLNAREVFIDLDGQQVCITVAPGEHPDGPLHVTGQGPAPFGSPVR